MLEQSPAEAEAPLPGRAGTLLLLFALAAAISFRLWLLIRQDFPIGDGGLFLEFVRACAAQFPALPKHVAYNGFSLPFAYPPLSFWIGGLFTRMGADPLGVVRVMPIVVNIFYLLMFALLLLKNGYSRLATALALLFFAVSLRSFEWLLMGGGMSRGLGALFLMLSLLAATVPNFKRGPPLPLWRSALAGVAVAGSILSHLEWGILAAASVVLSRALGSSSIKDFVVSCLGAGLTALLLIMPWLSFIIAQHGPDPFMSAAGTSSWDARGIPSRLFSIGLWAALANPFCVVGGVALLVQRRWFWPGFILLAAILTPRHAPTPITLALAVLAAEGAMSLYRLALRMIGTRGAVTAGAVVAVALVLALQVRSAIANAPVSFRSVAPETLQAMQWVSKRHPGGSFLVVNKWNWSTDISAEWFPALTGAISPATAQGREWRPSDEFGRWKEMTGRMKASRTCEELKANLAGFGSADFIWAETWAECFAADRYPVVYRNARVTVFAVPGQGA